MDLEMIEGALGQINYPVSKGELLQEVEDKGMSELRPLLNKLPDGQTFDSAEEVMQHLPVGALGGGGHFPEM